MTIKRFFFFLLMPIMVPLALFSNATHVWWSELYDKPFGIGKILFFILLPLYAPLAFFLNHTFVHWTKLAE